MNYTVYEILQARILDWVAVPFSRGSCQPRDQTQVFHIAGRFFTSWATREAQDIAQGQTQCFWTSTTLSATKRNINEAQAWHVIYAQ